MIYISHRFADISRLCDRATVLRDRRHVGEVDICAGHRGPGARDDAGRPDRSGQGGPPPLPAPARGPAALRVENLAVAPKLVDASLALHPGEVLGVLALRSGPGRIVRCPGRVPHAPIRPDRGSMASRPGSATRPTPSPRADLGCPETAAERRCSAKTLGPGKHRACRSRHGPAPGGRFGCVTKRPAWPEDDRTASDRHPRARRGPVACRAGNQQGKVTIGRWLAHGVRTMLLFDLRPD